MRALDSAPGNLPLQTTSFMGRESVEEPVTAMRPHRLVTLTGVGGVGKTRLALQVAAASWSEVPRRCLAVRTRRGHPASVPDAVATVLGVTAQAGMTVTESVSPRWRAGSRLMMLDNCEHVVDAAAELVEAVCSPGRP